MSGEPSAGGGARAAGRERRAVCWTATRQVAFVADATRVHVLQSYDEPAAGPAAVGKAQSDV